ncbi:HCL383Cp [Eremothecium sinecaudum]|uniref:HCL383Cp n=1 Tax=Eremothecium sinecaudum TaxID=45286 RepID=A0A109UY96_9SACH|nr:HCL383Cp [Eremothecium sinecaudum]AMD19768.1 HCL383Cp [Eremothecium sinecaudum]
MSSRQLRRLGNNDLEATLAKLTTTPKPKKPTNKSSTPVTANVFSQLNIGDEDTDEEDREHPLTEFEATQKSKTVVKLATKSQKKKSKKKQGRQNAIANEGVHPTSEPEEELDKILKEFQQKDVNLLKQGNDSTGSRASTASQVISKCDISDKDVSFDAGFNEFNDFTCLDRAFGCIEWKDLSPDNEFSLLFGDISPESLNDVDSMTSTHTSPQALKQIQRLKKLVRNWGGSDRRMVPNGGTVRRLQFTKIRDDWLPTQRGELFMKPLNESDILKWELWKCPMDWKDVVEANVAKWKKNISFFKFEPANTAMSKKSLTEFYLNVIVHPDHEALINLISAVSPYNVPALLQVAQILVRQGDSSNTNGLVERALFVFDRALRNGTQFDSRRCQLPYIYFYNRQFYLAIFRYLQIMSQRGALLTASTWTKVLWSLSPFEDPLGVRYFADHCLLLNKEYSYFISLESSELVTAYRNWYTLGIALGITLSYLKIGDIKNAKNALKRAFTYHSNALVLIFTELLNDSMSGLESLKSPITPAIELETNAYMIRFKAIWQDSDVDWLRCELQTLFKDYKLGKITPIPPAAVNPDSQFFIDGIPINLLRFVVLSQESSVMAKIPQKIWTNYDVHEFDVLPTTQSSTKFDDAVETVHSMVDEKELGSLRMAIEEDEMLLNQLRHMSLEQYLQDNPDAFID